MERPDESLVVRQHERHTCRLKAEASVAAGGGPPPAVVLSRSAGDGTGTVPGTVVDCSAGGLGLETSVFFPRSCRLRIRAWLGSDATVEVIATVQRVTMISREPRYYLGLAYLTGPDGGLGSATEPARRLLEHVAGAAAPGGTA